MKALYVSFIAIIALLGSGSVMAQDKKQENKQQQESPQKKEATEEPKSKEKETKSAQTTERKTVPQNLKSCGKK